MRSALAGLHPKLLLLRSDTAEAATIVDLQTEGDLVTRVERVTALIEGARFTNGKSDK